MFAAACAAVAAMFVRQTTEPVAAATDTSFTATGTATNFDARGTALRGHDTFNGTFTTGVYAVGSSFGMLCSSSGTGINSSGGTSGVVGFGNTYGVYGQGPHYGVAGFAFGGGAASVAVFAENDSSGQGGIAVRGNIPSISSAASTIGVYGENFSSNTGGAPGNGGFGCYGYSKMGHGLVGATGTAGGGAVVGSTNGVDGAYAGIFFGPFVVVNGSKSAAVANDDGSHSLLYCVESPESWFEDFGKAALTCGRAEVAIDPAFAAVADVSDYHVFLTDYGGHQLSVTSCRPTGFTVEADRELARLKGQQESELGGAFSWRLVAKRKDIAAPRLAKITLPAEPNRPEPATLEPPPPPPPRTRERS